MSPSPIKTRNRPNPFPLTNRLLVFWGVDMPRVQFLDTELLGKNIAEMVAFRKVYLGIPGILG